MLFVMIKGFVKHFRINISNIKIERRFDDSMSSLSSLNGEQAIKPFVGEHLRIGSHKHEKGWTLIGQKNMLCAIGDKDFKMISHNIRGIMAKIKSDLL